MATRLTGLLASDSPYIQQARAAGTRTAGRRGLLNSSIAAGSAETAAIAAGAPIASQDASQTFQRNQAVLEGGINFDNSSRLQSQQFEGQLGLQRDSAAHQLAMQEREAGYTRQRDELLAQGATAQQMREFEQRTTEQERNILAEEARQTAALSSNERTALMGADTNILQSQIAANSALTGQYLQAFSQLAGDPNIPAAVRNAYIGEFRRVMEVGQSLINVVQNTPLSWGPGTTPTTTAQSLPTSQPLTPVPA